MGADTRPVQIEWIEFVETSLFTRLVEQHGLEASLRDLQLALVQNPDAGDVDPGTGGLRKVRMPDPVRNKGKRGGARVHFLWLPRRKRAICCMCTPRPRVTR